MYYIDWRFACFLYTINILWGPFGFHFFFCKSKSKQKKKIWSARCTSLLSHDTKRRLGDHHPRPHTRSHDRAKWVQLTDTHRMSGRLDLGWLMRERLTDSSGQWKHESETWETYWPHAPGPRLPPSRPVPGGHRIPVVRPITINLQQREHVCPRSHGHMGRSRHAIHSH